MTVVEGLTTAFLGLLGAERLWSYLRHRSESQQDALVAQQTRLHSETWDLYRKACKERDAAIEEVRALERELSEVRSRGEGSDAACERCLERLAEEQGRAAGAIRRCEELEAELAREQALSRDQRIRGALTLADAMERSLTPRSDDMGQTSPEPRPFPLADDYDDPEHDTDPPTEED